MWLWKKWWAFTLVLTLALTLTSCATKRKFSNLSSMAGYTECQGYYLALEIGIFPAASGSANWDVVVNPVNVSEDAPGFHVALTGMGLSEEKPSVFVVGVEYTIKEVTLQEFNYFNEIVFVPNEGGSIVTDYNQFSDLTLFCELPMPQDGSTTNGSPGNFR